MSAYDEMHDALKGVRAHSGRLPIGSRTTPADSVARKKDDARILDIKYHLLLPSAADVGGAVDYYQWASLLQPVSGFGAYRKIYSEVITPRRVVEMLVLRDDIPRSLHRCMNLINNTLEISRRFLVPVD